MPPAGPEKNVAIGREREKSIRRDAACRMHDQQRGAHIFLSQAGLDPVQIADNRRCHIGIEDGRIRCAHIHRAGGRGRCRARRADRDDATGNLLDATLMLRIVEAPEEGDGETFGCPARPADR